MVADSYTITSSVADTTLDDHTPYEDDLCSCRVMLWVCLGRYCGGRTERIHAKP